MMRHTAILLILGATMGASLLKVVEHGVFLQPIHAQETVTLTTTESVPNLAGMRTGNVYIDFDNPDTAADEGMIAVHLSGVERPFALVCRYHATTSPTGTFLINGLNKANLSSAYAGNATTGTLKQRIYHRLVVMNEAPLICGRSLTGTLTGSVP